MRATIAFLLFTLISFSCMNSTRTYEYADGNGNVYTLAAKTLSFDPVKKEESSSGMYSGGEPKTVPITTVQYDSIRSMLETAMNDQSIQINDRVKMSGAISVSEDGSISRFVISPGSEILIKIETYLKVIISK
jgi:hypothetical protein